MLCDIVLLLIVWSVGSHAGPFIRFGPYEYAVSSGKTETASSFKEAVRKCDAESATLVTVSTMKVFDLLADQIQSSATAESPQIYYTSLIEIADDKVGLVWADMEPLNSSFERGMWYSNPFHARKSHPADKHYCGFAHVDTENKNLRLMMLSCDQDQAGYICQRLAIQISGRSAFGAEVPAESKPQPQSGVGKTVGILIPLFLVFILLGTYARKRYARKPKTKMVIFDAERNMRSAPKNTIKPPANTGKAASPNFELKMDSVKTEQDSIKPPPNQDGGETSGLSEYEDAVQCGAYKAQLTQSK